MVLAVVTVIAASTAVGEGVAKGRGVDATLRDEPILGALMAGAGSGEVARAMSWEKRPDTTGISVPVS